MKKIVILNDRMSNIQEQINLGDRALTRGFYNLVQTHFRAEIIPGGWKNFPYYNLKKFTPDAKKKDIERIFSKWMTAVDTVSRQSSLKQEKLLTQFVSSFIVNNPISRAIDEKVKKKNTRGLWAPFMPYLFRSYYAYQFKEKIAQADIVLNNSAGLITDRLEHYVPMSMFECYYAKKKGKKVAAVNQTVDVRKRLTQEIVGYAYRLLDFHLVREPSSVEKLKELGVQEEKIMVQPDSAFAAPYKTDEDVSSILEKENIPKGSIGILVRGDREVDIEAWAQFITFLHEKFKKKIIFVHSNVAHDEHIFLKLKGKCPIQQMSSFHNYPTLTEVISSFDLFITDRYHGAIFAIMAQTPLMPSKTRTVKLEGLMQLLDYSIEALPELVPESMEQYKKAAIQVYEKRDQIHEELIRAKKALSREVHGKYQKLGEFLQ